MSHSIEFPVTLLYVFLYNESGWFDYTLVETTQVFDTTQSFQSFQTWTALYDYAEDNGYSVPALNPFTDS